MPGRAFEPEFEMPFEWDAYPVLPPGAGEIPPLLQAGDPPPPGARTRDQSSCSSRLAGRRPAAALAARPRQAPGAVQPCPLGVPRAWHPSGLA